MNISASFVVPSLLVWLVLSLSSSGAQAKNLVDKDHGKVSMQGSIIDTPCAIAEPSREQLIDLITISREQVIRDGADSSKPFNIHLENCAFEQLIPDQQDWSHFMVNFDGLVTDGEQLALHGGAQGTGLKISDTTGNHMQPSFMRLDYFTTFGGEPSKLRARAYSTTLRFKQDYF